jgi:ABC-type branched-subunit amino acid transport system permease subunit
LNATNKTLLRWVAVLPAAAGAYAGAMFVTILAANAEGGVRTIIPHIAIPGNCIAAALFVWAGTRTAPAHKPLTAIVLAVVLSMAIAVLFTVGVMRNSPDSFTIGWMAFCGIIGIASAIATAWKFSRSTSA